MAEWYEDPRIKKFWLVKVGSNSKECNTELEAVGYAKQVASAAATPLIYRCTLESAFETTVTKVTIGAVSASREQEQT